jgi:hypothetical protein
MRQWHIPVSAEAESQLRIALAAENTAHFSWWREIRSRLSILRSQRRVAFALTTVTVVALFFLVNTFARRPEQALLAAATAYYSAATHGKLALAYATNDPRGLETSLNHSEYLNFHPPVVDLRPVGYRLLGGMVTDIGGQPAVVTVYEGEEGEVMFLCQGGTMPPPPRGAWRLKEQEYLYVSQGQTMLYSQFPDHFCVLISGLPADTFLHPLAFVPAP